MRPSSYCIFPPHYAEFRVLGQRRTTVAEAGRAAIRLLRNMSVEDLTAVRALQSDCWAAGHLRELSAVRTWHEGIRPNVKREAMLSLDVTEITSRSTDAVGRIRQRCVEQLEQALNHGRERT